MKISFLPLLSIKEIKKIESGYNHHDLLDNASKCLYKSITNLEEKYLSNILIICGPGNNGADGLYLSSILIKSGYQVDILFPDDFRSKQSALIKKLDLPENNIHNLNFDLENYIDNKTLIVDAIFGSGLNKQLNKTISDIIYTINKHQSFKISIDIPSGLDSEGKQTLTDNSSHINIFRSNLVVSFVSLKKGLFTAQGRDHWNMIHHYKLVTEKLTSNTFLFSLDDFKSIPISLDDFSHDDIFVEDISNQTTTSHKIKKTDAKGLIVGGNDEYLGALLLAAKAAIKTGVRYLTTLSSVKNSKIVPTTLPEVISHSFTEIVNQFPKSEAFLVGPGLGRNNLSEEVFSRFISLLQKKEIFTIIDADAIYFLSKNQSNFKRWVLTPHEGEAAKLLNKKINYIVEDRYRASKEIQKKYGGISVLKGAGTIVRDDLNTYICAHGNPGMAMAGMGDCLSGILLGCHFMTLNELHASLLGIGLHSKAADLIAHESGIKGLLPSDVIQQVSILLNKELV
ncbi:MAG: hypothetical protein CMD88_01655 [Gammaproteobacteria bacterium]|nr:hypothetical protein [Gammaproteobacteria bacterium]|tara:strand:+ start:245439 stop:246971 length:1533 start_codon:yes stop_codon:yes gene_type:complete